MADSSITYRSRYLTSLQTDLLLDLLLVDEANPRSIAFQLARLREHIEQLPGSQTAIRRPAGSQAGALSAYGGAARRRAGNGAQPGLPGGFARQAGRGSDTPVGDADAGLLQPRDAIAATGQFLKDAMKVLATHITRYWYSDPVSDLPQ